MNYWLVYKLAEVLNGVSKSQRTVDNDRLLAKASG